MSKTYGSNTRQQFATVHPGKQTALHSSKTDFSCAAAFFVFPFFPFEMTWGMIHTILQLLECLLTNLAGKQAAGKTPGMKHYGKPR